MGGGGLSEGTRQNIAGISKAIEEALEENVLYTRYAGKWMGNYDVKAVRHLTDGIDQVVLEELGLGQYWPDLELEYVRFMKMTGERPGTRREKPDFGE